MVILLQPGCLDGLTDPIVRRDLLQDLGEARYRGRHHLAGPPRILAELAETPGLSASAVDGWKTASRWSVKNLPRCRALTPRLELCRELPQGEELARGVHYLRPADPGLEASRSRATLGGEDADDARYLRALAHLFLLAQSPDDRLEDSVVALDPMSLGGSTAAATARNHLDTHRALLAVADSDRLDPHQPLRKDQPAALLQKAETHWRRDHPDGAPFFVEVLPCYSIENLLLADLVAQLPPRHGLPDPDILKEAFEHGLLLSATDPSPDLRHLPLSGQSLCQGWFVTKGAPVKAVHDHLALRRGTRAPRDPACSSPCGPTLKKEPPPACQWVRSVGKKLLPAVALAAEQTLKSSRSAAPLIRWRPLHGAWPAPLLGRIAAWGLAPRAPYASPG